jgi:hypothetical protein
MTKWNRFAIYLFGLLLGMAIAFVSASQAVYYETSSPELWGYAFFTFAAAVGLGFYLNRDASPQK